MKRTRLFVIMLLITFATVTVGSTLNVSTVSAASMKISQKKLTLEVGKTATLKVSGTKKKVKWTIDKKKVATVSSKGVVKAKAVGTAKITGKVGKKKFYCKVTVKNSTPVVTTVDVTGVTLNQNNVTVNKGDTVTLTATVAPTNATNKTVQWTSNNETIATVDSNGVVTTKAAGTVVITATSGSFSTACTITVNKTYGNVSGKVVFTYNGTVYGDNGADIILVPTDGSAKNTTISTADEWNKSSTYTADKNIYYGEADEYGSYSIANVPTGEYMVLVSSYWTGPEITDQTQYTKNIRDIFVPYLNDVSASNIAQSVYYYSYYTSKITVNKDQTTTLDHDFGTVDYVYTN